MKSQTQNMAFNISQVFFTQQKLGVLKCLTKKSKSQLFQSVSVEMRKNKKQKAKTKQRKQTEEVFAVNET